MKSKLPGICLGLALLAGAGTAANAADWNGGAGSIKDMRGSAAVPVPAPMPIPVYQPQYYFRADFGLSIAGSDPDGSESGLLFGTQDSPGALGPTPFGTSPSWFNSDFDTFMTWGVGAGGYVNDRVRMDVTLEGRTGGDLTIDGSTSYITHGYDAFYGDGYGPLPHDGAGNGQQRTRVTVYDSTQVRSVFSMVNAYWDFGKFHGFVPYVGGGLGVALHETKRNHLTRVTDCDLTSAPPCATEFLRYETPESERSDKQHDIALAAQLTAGFSYQISDITALDFNYRYLYIEGTDVYLTTTGADGVARNSKVTIGDTQEHQLRAGLRFNIH